MSGAQIAVFAQISERADVKWRGSDGNIPILEVADVSVHLSHLGADLGPWLFALSDRLAEFAATVDDDGTRAVRTTPTPAELVEQSQASAEAERRARLDAGLARWSR